MIKTSTTSPSARHFVARRHRPCHPNSPRRVQRADWRDVRTRLILEAAERVFLFRAALCHDRKSPQRRLEISHNKARTESICYASDRDLEPATFHVAMKRREHSDRSLT